MTNLYLVRHAQTQWNVEHRRQGRSDSPLTETGATQAQSVAMALKNINFDLVLSSPSKRAVDTANIIVNSLLHVIEDENLYEMGFGIWEGKTPAEMKALHDVNEEYFWKCPGQYQCPQGGEDFASLIHRSESFLQDITGRRYDAENILAVSHTATIKAILMLLLKRELDHIWDEPFVHAASLTQIRFYSREDYEIIRKCEVFYTL